MLKNTELVRVFTIYRQEVRPFTDKQIEAFVPQPVVDKTPQQLRGYIEGLDPTTKRPFMQEVIEGLSNSTETKTAPT
jgi:hypothetical protein